MKRLVYADPPYIGYARYYRDDPRAAEVDHAALVAQLDADYDGWALSCYSNSLRLILPHCPQSVRVGAWVKPWCSWKPGVSPKYGWESVIFKPARKRQPKGLYPVDWVNDPRLKAGACTSTSPPVAFQRVFPLGVGQSASGRLTAARQACLRNLPRVRKRIGVPATRQSGIGWGEARLATLDILRWRRFPPATGNVQLS